MKGLLGALLTLVSLSAEARPTDEMCLGQAVWHEGRGEPLKTQKAILQTVLNRARINGESVCTVVMASSQFPWARNIRSWKLTNKQLTNLQYLYTMGNTVSSMTYYFNDQPVKYGIPYRKLGKMWFNLKEKK